MNTHAQFVETGLIVGKDGGILKWHEPIGATGGHLPDGGPNSAARAMWEFFRDNWKDIQGFAHTHPGGFHDPSWMDITTFAAIELGLDLRFDWWIVTSRVSLVRWKGPDRHQYGVELLGLFGEPTWVGALRARSRKNQVKT